MYMCCEKKKFIHSRNVCIYMYICLLFIEGKIKLYILEMYVCIYVYILFIEGKIKLYILEMYVYVYVSLIY